MARGESWRFATLQSSLDISDARGRLLLDRFILTKRSEDEAACDAPGFTEANPYFAMVVVVADAGIEALVETVDEIATEATTAGLAVARLLRRGAVMCCLAPTAAVLTEVIELIWGASRRQVLGASPLDLRKS